MASSLGQIFNLQPQGARIFDYDLLCEIPFCAGILSGRGGLVWYAVTNMPRNFIELATERKEIDDKSIGGIQYSYQDEVDSENFLIPCPYNVSLKIPTLERSIVDYQRYDSGCMDDEHFTEAIEEYDKRYKGDFSGIYEVADFYGCRPLMEEAIKLAKTYY